LHAFFIVAETLEKEALAADKVSKNSDWYTLTNTVQKTVSVYQSVAEKEHLKTSGWITVSY